MPYLVDLGRLARHILFFLALVLPVAACDSESGTNGTMDQAPGPVRALGAEDAPVTIIDYSSLTCPHCAQFHTDILPELKKKYIDTGKVRLVYRNFPLDNVAHKAAMLVSCAPEGKYFQLLDLLFARQRQWATSEDPRSALMNLGKMVGIDERRFDACINDTELGNLILEERVYGDKTYKIRSTPTFVIRGENHVGALPIEDFDAILAPLLSESGAN
ncbi:MAG: DsbA family protein [Alphaproteobacteria bacterium]|nr:DsbA family protein [Alphaproteobacteria bacterium]